MSLIMLDQKSYTGAGFGGFGGDLKIVSVSGSTIEVSGSPAGCGPKIGEIRRHATGIHEFVGTVTGSSKLSNGNTSFNLDYGHLTSRPQSGETVYVYCSGSHPSGGKGGGSGSSGTSIIPAGVVSAGSNYGPILLIAAVGIGAYFLLSK